MTILYKPVLIESAEQAEALPVGTIFHDEETEWRYTRRADGTVRSLFRDIKAGVSVTALAPIEAEEEFQDIDAYEASGHMRRHHLARYVTPWEEA